MVYLVKSAIFRGPNRPFKLHVSYTLYVSLPLALTGLHELSLDNTLVTDAGVMCLSSLTRLDVLSLSDTK